MKPKRDENRMTDDMQMREPSPSDHHSLTSAFDRVKFSREPGACGSV